LLARAAEEGRPDGVRRDDVRRNGADAVSPVVRAVGRG